MKHNNIDINKPQDIANILAQIFENNSNNDRYDPQFQIWKITAEYQEITIEKDPYNSFNFDFTMCEIENVIKELKSGSSPGPDGIPFELIRNLPMPCIAHILSIYNKIWSTKTYPSRWNEVIIVPILKPNKPKHDLESYRPIALANTLCKIFEEMAYKRLIWYMERNNIVAYQQCGLRGRRTNDHLIALSSEIQDAFKNKQHFIGVFFDIERAYDTAWYHYILKSLQEHKVEGNMLHFIKNSMSNRTFRVKFNDHISDMRSQKNGVPQGSTISVTLFLLAINKIMKHINAPVKALLYADDPVIFSKGKNIKTLRQNLQTTIEKLKEWSQETGFKFSNSKTNAMYFSANHRPNPQVPPLTLYNLTINYANTTYFWV